MRFPIQAGLVAGLLCSYCIPAKTSDVRASKNQGARKEFGVRQHDIQAIDETHAEATAENETELNDNHEERHRNKPTQRDWVKDEPYEDIDDKGYPYQGNYPDDHFRGQLPFQSPGQNPHLPNPRPNPIPLKPRINAVQKHHDECPFGLDVRMTSDRTGFVGQFREFGLSLRAAKNQMSSASCVIDVMIESEQPMTMEANGGELRGHVNLRQSNASIRVLGYHGDARDAEGRELFARSFTAPFEDQFRIQGRNRHTERSPCSRYMRLTLDIRLLMPPGSVGDMEIESLEHDLLDDSHYSFHPCR